MNVRDTICGDSPSPDLTPARLAAGRAYECLSTIQRKKKKGEPILDKDQPEEQDFAAYIAWCNNQPVPVLKVEAYEGTGEPEDFIGVKYYVAMYNASGEARPGT